jgi:hypothetical protein
MVSRSFWEQRIETQPGRGEHVFDATSGEVVDQNATVRKLAYRQRCPLVVARAAIQRSAPS